MGLDSFKLVKTPVQFLERFHRQPGHGLFWKWFRAALLLLLLEKLSITRPTSITGPENIKNIIVNIVAHAEINGLPICRTTDIGDVDVVIAHVT